MKTLLLALLLGLSTFATSNLHAEEDVCFTALSEHMTTVENSEKFLTDLGSHSDEISSFEIVEFQKNMTARLKSLKAFQAVYKDEKLNCQPKVLSKAVAIYDYSRAGKSIFSNTTLRRVFLGFSKYTRFELTNYIADYKKFTSNDYIDDVEKEINSDGAKLPDAVIFSKSQLGYDPNLYSIGDAAITGTTSIVAGAARVWGFISDHMKWRQGRIRGNQEATSLLRSKLKPLDMIFEKRTFTLSNYTIPGHWGHVGVWLGTKEELIALNVWDQEYFKPFREFVEKGMNIVEIRKEGLNFQSIDTFINLDEIAVTRVTNILDRAKTVFEDLSEQIDKKYDFKFDALTADKITCAELIAFSYGDIKWPMTKTLFQLSLRPDDLAVLSLTENSNVEFVLYLKGRKKKEGGGFDQKSFDDWSKLFKVKKHLSPEEISAERIENEKLEKERKEREAYNEIYRGA